MAGATRTNLGLLQLDYEDLIVEALAMGANAFKHPKTLNWEGEAKDWRVHVERNGNHGFTEDGGAFSVPGKQSYVTARIGVRFFEKKLQITNGALAAARTGAKSFRSVVDSEVKGATTDVMDFYNQIFFLDGTGQVATVDASWSSGHTDVPVNRGRSLWAGTTYDIYSSANASKGTATVANVESLLSGTGTSEPYVTWVNFDAAPTGGAFADGDKIFWKNSRNRAIAGLDNLIDDTLVNAFQNVDTETYPDYTSYVNSNSGTLRDMTPQIFRQTMASLIQRAGNKFKQNPTGGLKVFGNAFLLKEFEEMYEGAYRLEGSGSQGYSAPKFTSALGTVSFEVDTDCPRHKIFLADMSQIDHCVQKPMGFEKDGGQIFRQSHQSAHVTAVMTCISQMRIKDRKSSAKIEDLSDSARISA